MDELVGSVDCKDFLGFEAKILTDISSQISRLQVFKPYQYTCLLDFQLLTVSFADNLTPQQATNIIKKCIEAYKDDNDIFWYRRASTQGKENYAEDLLAKAELKKPHISLCIDDYIELPVDHAEKPYKLLDLVANRLSNVGATAPYRITAEDLISCYIPVEPFENEIWYSNEGDKIVDSLVDEKYVDKFWPKVKDHRSIGRTISVSQSGGEPNKKWQVALTMHGWSSLSSLNINQSNKVFIAMAFSSWENKEERNNLVSSIQAACNQYGYDANIVDPNHTGNITDKIISEIKKAKFIVCDFTYQNQGAYYEAGYARALGKSVYHLVRKDHFDSLHFDIRQINCRTWTTPDEAETVLEEWLGANEENIKS